MARTTVSIESDDLLRLKYYQTVFGFGSLAEVITSILNKSGLATAHDIRRLRQMQHKTDVVVDE